MKLMRYCAVGVGGMELPILDKYTEAAKDVGIQVLHVGPADIPGAAPYIIKQVGPVRVGIVSFGVVRPEDDNLQLNMRRYSAFKEARDKSDILVLLDQAGAVSKEWLEHNTKWLGYPDVVIGGQKWFSISHPEVIGGTHIMPTSMEAKNVGVVKVKLIPGGRPELTFSQTFLDSKLQEDPEVKKMVEELKQAERQPVAAPGAGQTVANQYYDSATCSSCHKSQHDSWMKGKHAAAVKSLRKTKDDRPQCLTCHSEKFRMTAQYQPTEAYSVGVECASCHNRVLPHGATGPAKGVAKISLDVCRTCHTKERSPDFEGQSATYWQKAGHGRAKSS